jgi:hypothetical protein
VGQVSEPARARAGSESYPTAAGLILVVASLHGCSQPGPPALPCIACIACIACNDCNDCNEATTTSVLFQTPFQTQGRKTAKTAEGRAEHVSQFPSWAQTPGCLPPWETQGIRSPGLFPHCYGEPKLVLHQPYEDFMDACVNIYGFVILPVEPRHTARVAALPFPPNHKDPFDRLIVAQALVGGRHEHRER